MEIYIYICNFYYNIHVLYVLHIHIYIFIFINILYLMYSNSKILEILYRETEIKHQTIKGMFDENSQLRKAESKCRRSLTNERKLNS